MKVSRPKKFLKATSTGWRFPKGDTNFMQFKFFYKIRKNSLKFSFDCWISIMKFATFILLTAVLVFVDTKVSIKVKELECVTSEKSVTNLACSLKNKPNSPIISFGFDLKQKVPDVKVWNFHNSCHFFRVFNFLQLHFTIYRKAGDEPFTKVFTVVPFEWCRVVDGTKTAPFLDIVLREVRKNANDLTEVCSRNGKFNVSNYSFSRLPAIMSKFPVGNYKFEVQFFDDKDDNIFKFNMFMTLQEWKEKYLRKLFEIITSLKIRMK